MSIAARIHSARMEAEGVRIFLGPIRRGEVAGQRSLLITNWPEGANPAGLVGTDIWGGSDAIMVGETKWAHRRGYTRIELVEP